MLIGRLLAGLFAAFLNICFGEILNKIVPTQYI
jgi:hypothetical protein